MRPIFPIATILLLALIALFAMPVHALTPITASNPNYGGCVIVTDKGSLQDADCDKVPDVVDNCPFTYNPDQTDRDHNGIGDACDLIIDQVTVEPQTPMQGRSMLVTVWLMNNRAYPMQNMIAKLEVPTLGLSTNEALSVINPGQRVSKELLVTIPACAPTTPTDVVVTAEYPFAPGQQEVFSQALKVPIVASGLCSKEVSDTTVVNVLQMQDVSPTTGALYPFTIHNNQADSKAYVLSAQGMEDWGSVEINPGTVIVVPPGESRDGAIQLWAKPGVSGSKTFTFTVQARDDSKQIMLTANIPAPAQPAIAPQLQLFWGIIGFLGILLLIAAILIYVSAKKKKR